MTNREHTQSVVEVTLTLCELGWSPARIRDVSSVIGEMLNEGWTALEISDSLRRTSARRELDRAHQKKVHRSRERCPF